MLVRLFVHFLIDKVPAPKKKRYPPHFDSSEKSTPLIYIKITSTVVNLADLIHGVLTILTLYFTCGSELLEYFFFSVPLGTFNESCCPVCFCFLICLRFLVGSFCWVCLFVLVLGALPSYPVYFADGCTGALHTHVLFLAAAKPSLSLVTVCPSVDIFSWFPPLPTKYPSSFLSFLNTSALSLTLSLSLSLQIENRAFLVTSSLFRISCVNNMITSSWVVQTLLCRIYNTLLEFCGQPYQQQFFTNF